jgi:hypothetical protein
LNGIIVGEVPATGDLDKDLKAMRQFLKDKGLHKEVTKVQAMVRQALFLNDCGIPAPLGLAQNTTQWAEPCGIRGQLSVRH